MDGAARSDRRTGLDLSPAAHYFACRQVFLPYNTEQAFVDCPACRQAKFGNQRIYDLPQIPRPAIRSTPDIVTALA